MSRLADIISQSKAERSKASDVGLLRAASFVEGDEIKFKLSSIVTVTYIVYQFFKPGMKSSSSPSCGVITFSFPHLSLFGSTNTKKLCLPRQKCRCITNYKEKTFNKDRSCGE